MVSDIYVLSSKNIVLFDFSIIFNNLIDVEQDAENEIGEYENLMNEEDYRNNEQQTDTDAEIGVKKFIEEFTDDDLSKVARTSETEPRLDTNVYHCSECNINFLSIQDHIDSCHKGQEVVFQVDFFFFLILVFDVSVNFN